MNEARSIVTRYWEPVLMKKTAGDGISSVLEKVKTTVPRVKGGEKVALLVPECLTRRSWSIAGFRAKIIGM